MKTPGWILQCCLLSTLSFSAYADSSLSFELGRWQPDYSGSAGLEGNSATFDELGYDDFDHDLLIVTLRHPVPLLPNVRFQTVELESNGVGTPEGDFVISDGRFTGGFPITSRVDLSFKDLTFFYSPVNHWIRLDLGLTYRHFDGSIAGNGFRVALGRRFETNVDKIVDLELALIYAAAKIDLPLTEAYVNFTGNFFNYDGDDVADWTVAAGYTHSFSKVKWSAELGLRILEITSEDFDNDSLNENLDLKMEGLYLQLGLTF
ncbi:MAG: outer membrane protein [Cellvibrionaceae bacterium]|jgi:outer membrane protein